MEPFSTELLTILVLICISWTGVTFIAVLIILAAFIYSSCSKCCRSKSIKPSQSPSTISIRNHSPIASPVPIKNIDQHKKSEQKIYPYDGNSIINDNPYINKNKYQQQEYMHDENDETTTTTINKSRMYGQRHKKRPFKPVTDVRIIDRHTPYPPDVLAREKLMNNSRFSRDDKY